MAVRMIKKGVYGQRLLKTSAVVISSFCLGAAFTKFQEKERADANSLAVNINQLPQTQRVLIASIQSLTQSPHSAETFVSSAKEVLSQVRKLKANIATHHVIRIQAASLLQQYHNNLDTVLSERAENNEIDADEYNMHFRRKLDDMAFAFDLVDFDKSEVSSNISSLLKLNKMDYARQSRDAHRLKSAYDEIVRSAKLLMKNQDDAIASAEAGKEDETKDASITREKLTDIDQGSLLESDLVAIYTHAPYLGEWQTFEKIGSSLMKDYNRNDFVLKGTSGHKDGIDFSDLFLLCKDYNCADNIPSRLHTELKFDQKPIRSIKLKYHSASVINPNTSTSSDTSDSSEISNVGDSGGNGWFGGMLGSNTNARISDELENILRHHNSSAGSMKEVELNGSTASGRSELRTSLGRRGRARSSKTSETGDSGDTQELVPLGIRRLGGVQKAPSLTKCVRRVQGPILHDGSVRMQGSMTVLVPRSSLERVTTSAEDSLVPQDIPLIGAGEFVSIRQTEMWDLKPEGKDMNELSGKVVIRREPANERDAGKIDAFEVEYDCKMSLSERSTEFANL